MDNRRRYCLMAGIAALALNAGMASAQMSELKSVKALRESPHYQVSRG